MTEETKKESNRDPWLDQEKLNVLNQTLKLWRRDFLVRARMGLFTDMATWLCGSNPQWGAARGLSRSDFGAYRYRKFDWLDGPRTQETDFIPLVALMTENLWWTERDTHTYDLWKKRWSRMRDRYRNELHEKFGVKPPRSDRWSMNRIIWDSPEASREAIQARMIAEWKAKRDAEKVA